MVTFERQELRNNPAAVGTLPPPETTPGAEQRATTREFVAGGSIAEGIGGLGAIVLAIIGLANIVPFYMAAVGTIVIGASLLLLGAAIAARFSRLSAVTGGDELGTVELGGGTSAEFVGGAAGVVLGILALLNIVPWVLMSVGAIVFGAALLLGAGAMSSLNSARLASRPMTLARATAREVVWAGAGAQGLIGLAGITLGIIAVCGIHPETLVLVSLLCLGCSVLLSGGAIGGKMMTLAS